MARTSGRPQPGNRSHWFHLSYVALWFHAIVQLPRESSGRRRVGGAIDEYQTGAAEQSMSDHGRLADVRASSARWGSRGGAEKVSFVKFDCWHTLDLPLIRQAFPRVPWVFVYRDPVEVLVSQMTKPSWWMSGALSPERIGVDLQMINESSREDLCARVLAGICEAALDGLEDGNGRAVAYDELPHAVWTSLADHFGVGYSTDEIDRMKQSALMDSKTPQMFFSDDRVTKQRAVTLRIREGASAHLNGLYDRLEAFRGVTNTGAARSR